MKIRLYKINPDRFVEIENDASSLDGLTRDLPEGLYTTFNTLMGASRVMGLSAHLQRLYGPAKIEKIPITTGREALRKNLAQIAKMNLPGESKIRIVVCKDNGQIHVMAQEFTPLPDSVYRDGVKTITAPIVRHDANLKYTGFISESDAQRKLVNTEIFEVLLTKDRMIYEGMTSNFYAVIGGKIVTAKRGILPGVTRRSVLTIAKGQGMSIHFRSPRMDEKFEEAFLTSSSRGIVPIVMMDQNPIDADRVGEVVKGLMERYKEYVEEESEDVIGK